MLFIYNFIVSMDINKEYFKNFKDSFKKIFKRKRKDGYLIDEMLLEKHL